MLPAVNGEFGIGADPEPRFSDKGNAWVSLRVVAKDRVRDSNGNWTDGEPLWLNAMVIGKAAEHLTDSVRKGDNVVIVGKLRPNVWTDKEGREHNDVQIMVDEIGPSLRWQTAKTPASEGDSTPKGDSFSGAQGDPDEMPF